MINRTNGRSRDAAPVVLLTIVALLGGLPSCQTATRTSDRSFLGPIETQNVLVLIAQEDPSGSFRDLEETLARNLAQFPLIQPSFVRIGGAHEFRRSILAEAKFRGPIDGLLLAFHGKPNRLYLSATETLHQRNVQQSCEGLSQALHPEAPIILYSCLTGEGDDNLAGDLAKAMDRTVMAPAHYWLMQTALAADLRMAELALDQHGRLTVDAGKFGLFYKKRHRTNRDRYLIAPLPMAEICRVDGFVKRRSRARSLFPRYRP